MQRKPAPHVEVLAAAFELADALDRRYPLWTLRRIITPEWSGRRLLSEIDRSF
jgi:hypothetical protein